MEDMKFELEPYLLGSVESGEQNHSELQSDSWEFVDSQSSEPSRAPPEPHYSPQLEHHEQGNLQVQGEQHVQGIHDLSEPGAPPTEQHSIQPLELHEKRSNEHIDSKILPETHSLQPSEQCEAASNNEHSKPSESEGQPVEQHDRVSSKHDPRNESSGQPEPPFCQPRERRELSRDSLVHCLRFHERREQGSNARALASDFHHQNTSPEASHDQTASAVPHEPHEPHKQGEPEPNNVTQTNEPPKKQREESHAEHGQNGGQPSKESEKKSVRSYPGDEHGNSEPPAPLHDGGGFQHVERSRESISREEHERRIESLLATMVSTTEHTLGHVLSLVDQKNEKIDDQLLVDMLLQLDALERRLSVESESHITRRLDEQMNVLHALRKEVQTMAQAQDQLLQLTAQTEDEELSSLKQLTNDLNAQSRHIERQLLSVEQSFKKSPARQEQDAIAQLTVALALCTDEKKVLRKELEYQRQHVRDLNEQLRLVPCPDQWRRHQAEAEDKNRALAKTDRDLQHEKMMNTSLRKENDSLMRVEKIQHSMMMSAQKEYERSIERMRASLRSNIKL